MRPEHAFAASLFNPGSRDVVLRGQTKGLAVAEIHRSEFRLADLHRILEQGLEHRLQFTRRRADNLQHFRGRSLLLERFAQLVEQPRVLDGDHGLISKRPYQRNLLVRKGPYLPPPNSDSSHQIPVVQKRDGQDGPGPIVLENYG